jgi:hypothetical protein
MASSHNGIIYLEYGQTLVDYTTLTDSGDHKFFKSSATKWSRATDKEPDIRPNGILSGCLVSPAASGTNDLVDVSAGVAYLNGEQVDVAASTDLSITRPAGGGDEYKKVSVVIDNTGTIAADALGTDHTAFSDTRGGDGGPPLIPVDEIEVAQIHLSSSTAAAITDDEIKQVNGVHRESALSPAPNILYFNVTDGALGYAGVEFNTALPLIHTGGVAKRVYAKYYTPITAAVGDASSFVPPVLTVSTSSTKVYGGAVGSVSTDISGGSFTCYPRSGLLDDIFTLVGENVFVLFYPDRNKTQYWLVQGYITMSPSYDPENPQQLDFTIASDQVSKRVIA